jgi:diguanylate cyclase (GGDEF)-like protein
VEVDRSETKILVADDSAVYRKLVEHAFSDQGYTVVFADNGREALRLFSQHRPALVITDWAMPDISGLELCQRLRRNFEDLYPYVILLTSNTEKEQVVEGLAAGADDYLTKPFHAGELRARVRVGFRIVSLHREIQAKNRQLEELALTDSLTGLPNRRAIDEWAPRTLSAAARHNFPVWVALADLDQFKRVNDTFGHKTGDAVLRAFAETLKSNTRQSNICGRFGGEEFITIVTHVERHNMMLAMDRIRHSFELQPFETNGKTFTSTVSFGISGFAGKVVPRLELLIDRADQALYSAKKNGRNRVEFAD